MPKRWFSFALSVARVLVGLATAALALHRSAIWLIIVVMLTTNVFFLGALTAEPHRVFHLW